MHNPRDIPVRLEEGPELLGAMFAVGLWGITCVQTIFYFIHFSHDKSVIKAMVTWLWLTDTTHQLLLIKGVYMHLIINVGNPEEVFRMRMEFLWQVMLTTFVALPSQFFFVNRIAKFGGKRWLPFMLLAPAAMFELVGGLVFIGFGTVTPSTIGLMDLIPSAIFTAAQATAAVVDISITATLIFLLWKSRVDALHKMRTVIQRLLILSLSTGVWTALFAIFTLITMSAFPNTFIYGGVYFPLCPIYCNTVLASLNARHVIRQLERRTSAPDSTLWWRDVESADPTATLGQSHGLAQTLRCRCPSANYVEAGVQTSLGSVDTLVAQPGYEEKIKWRANILSAPN